MAQDHRVPRQVRRIVSGGIRVHDYAKLVLTRPVPDRVIDITVNDRSCTHGFSICKCLEEPKIPPGWVNDAGWYIFTPQGYTGGPRAKIYRVPGGKWNWMGTAVRASEPEELQVDPYEAMRLARELKTVEELWVLPVTKRDPSELPPGWTPDEDNKGGYAYLGEKLNAPDRTSDRQFPSVRPDQQGTWRFHRHLCNCKHPENDMHRAMMMARGLSTVDELWTKDAPSAEEKWVYQGDERCPGGWYKCWHKGSFHVHPFASDDEFRVTQKTRGTTSVGDQPQVFINLEVARQFVDKTLKEQGYLRMGSNPPLSPS